MLSWSNRGSQYDLLTTTTITTGFDNRVALGTLQMGMDEYRRFHTPAVFASWRFSTLGFFFPNIYVIHEVGVIGQRGRSKYRLNSSVGEGPGSFC